MSLKHSLGTSLQSLCHSQDPISDGHWITSANFSFAHWRNISHAALAAVTHPSVTDYTCGLIAKTTCVRVACAACHGRSQPLSAGSTGDLSVTLRPKALGPPVPYHHLEMSPPLTGGGWMTVTLVVIFFFFFSFHSFLITTPGGLYGQATAAFAPQTTRTYSKNPTLILCSTGVSAAVASFNIAMSFWVLFHRVGDRLSESWRTVCIRQVLNSPVGPGC